MDRPDDGYRAHLAAAIVPLVADAANPARLDQLEHLRTAVMVLAAIVESLLPAESDLTGRAALVDRMNAIRAARAQQESQR